MIIGPYRNFEVFFFFFFLLLRSSRPKMLDFAASFYNVCNATSREFVLFLFLFFFGRFCRIHKIAIEIEASCQKTYSFISDCYKALMLDTQNFTISTIPLVLKTADDDVFGNHTNILPLTSMDALALGALSKVYTHIYSPASSALGLVSLLQKSIIKF